MENLILLASAFPMGDDTPILLYAVLGIVAAVLIVVSVLLGKKGKDDGEKDQKS